MLVLPTNDDLTCLRVGRPIEDLQEFGTDIETHFREVVGTVSEFAADIDAEKSVEDFEGAAVTNSFRRPSGPVRGSSVTAAFA